MNSKRLAVSGLALTLAFLGACGSDDDTDNPSNNTGNSPTISVPTSDTTSITSGDTTMTSVATSG